MKISFLVPDISGPVVGPVTELARALQPKYEVEIAGPDLGRGVCVMYRQSFNYKVVSTPRLYRLPNFLWETCRLGRAITGDVVIAVKAYADTVPVAWWQKFRHGRKMVVYLDEWDASLYWQLSLQERKKLWRRHFYHPMEENYFPVVEQLIPCADTVISTSTFLQKKFGGHIVPMGVDMDFFAPQPVDEVQVLRRELDLNDKKLIVFGGVVRAHKGIEQIPEALALLGKNNYRFVIVGPVNEHVQAMKQNDRYGSYVVALGPQPKENMPRYLDMADLVVLPMLDSLMAQSQTPCKVFEAMSMAKPIIASAISDLPIILNGCGWVVPPENVEALAQQVEYVFSNEDESKKMGQKAREKCGRLYSREKTADRLQRIVASLVK